MIRKSGNRFSEKIMLNQNARAAFDRPKTIRSSRDAAAQPNVNA
jgi:hypothetical protein